MSYNECSFAIYFNLCHLIQEKVKGVKSTLIKIKGFILLTRCLKYDDKSFEAMSFIDNCLFFLLLDPLHNCAEVFIYEHFN